MLRPVYWKKKNELSKELINGPDSVFKWTLWLSVFVKSLFKNCILLIKLDYKQVGDYETWAGDVEILWSQILSWRKSLSSM